MIFDEQVFEVIGRLVVEKIERELSVVFELEKRELAQTRCQVQEASRVDENDCIMLVKRVQVN